MALDAVPDALVSILMEKTFTSADVTGRNTLIFGEEGIGKTKLACELGDSNLLITDEQGIVSLQNHPELDAKTFAVSFDGDDKAGCGYQKVALYLRAAENGQLINPKNGEPVDNVVFDTISGIVQTRIHRALVAGELRNEKGAIHGVGAAIPAIQHYQLSEQEFLPIARMCAQMQRCSVTFLSHLRTGDKTVRGSSTRADIHGAAYKALARYCSVVAYLHQSLETGGRVLQVMPGNQVGAKTRRNFGKNVLTDLEFIEAMQEWKETAA